MGGRKTRIRVLQTVEQQAHRNCWVSEVGLSFADGWVRQANLLESGASETQELLCANLGVQTIWSGRNTENALREKPVLNLKVSGGDRKIIHLQLAGLERPSLHLLVAVCEMSVHYW